MAETALTDFEHVLLAMICTAPSSGYDLKLAFSTTPLGVYQPSSGALYPALRRLERRGLIHSRRATDRSGNARRRRVYEPTDRGRDAHLAWIRAPVDAGTVSRQLGLHLLRFVMMEPLLGREEVLGFLHDLDAALGAFLERLERHTDQPASHARHPSLALQHGIAVHQASQNWVKHTIANLTTAPKSPAEPPLRNTTRHPE